VDLRATAVEDEGNTLRRGRELALGKDCRVMVVVHDHDVEPGGGGIDALQLLVGGAIPVAVADVHNDAVAIVASVLADGDAVVLIVG